MGVLSDELHVRIQQTKDIQYSASRSAYRNGIAGRDEEDLLVLASLAVDNTIWMMEKLASGDITP